MLEAAGVAERRRDDKGRCLGVRIGSLIEGEDERGELRFSSPLMPFAIEVIATLDREDPTYVADVVSVVESVLDDPRQILDAQEHAARGVEVARLKSEHVEYEERMERLEGITWPRPLADVLESCVATYREHHPWIADDPSPKSILREMLESGDSFATFVGRYRLDRSEGLVLRYLTDAWRTLDRSLPEDVYTSDLEDIVEWLDALIRATDATLLDEWTRLAGGPVHERHAPEALTAMRTGPPAAWRTAVRTAAFGLGRAAGCSLARSTRQPDRMERVTDHRRDAPLLDRVRRHRHRCRCTFSGTLHAGRGTWPMDDHATTRRPRRRWRVAIRRYRRPRPRRSRGRSDDAAPTHR